MREDIFAEKVMRGQSQGKLMQDLSRQKERKRSKGWWGKPIGCGTKAVGQGREEEGQAVRVQSHQRGGKRIANWEKRRAL